MVYNSLWFDLMQLRLRSAPTAARSAVVFEGALLRCVPGSRSLDRLRLRARRSASVGCHRWFLCTGQGAPFGHVCESSLRLRLASPHLTDPPGFIRGALRSRLIAPLCRRHLLQLAPRAMLRIALVAGASPPHHSSPVKTPAPEGGDIVSNSENPSGFLRSPIPKGIPSETGDGGAPPGARKGRANL